MTTTLTLTEDEMKIVRSALCRASMRALCHAQEVEKEEKEKGLDCKASKIFYDHKDIIKSIIKKIDEEQLFIAERNG